MGGSRIVVRVEPHWSLRSDDGRHLDSRCLTMLQAIEQGGTLRSAATAAGISYRHAWNLLRDWEALFETPLVALERGRGAHLTPLGLRLLRADQRLRARLTPTLMSLAAEFESELAACLDDHDPPPRRLHASHGFAIAKLRDALEGQREARWELQFRSTTDAIAALAQRNCDVAAFHVPCTDHTTGDIAALRDRVLAAHRPWLHDGLKVLPFVIRTQGLMLPSGNPADIQTLDDLHKHDLRFVNRQSGSGSRALFDGLLARTGIERQQLRGYQHEEFTHSAIAACVAAGMADIGFGVEAAAHAFDLTFIPLVEEQYSLLCWADFLDTAAATTLLTLLADPRFQNEINAIPGYRCTNAGGVVELADVLG